MTVKDCHNHYYSAIFVAIRVISSIAPNYQLYCSYITTVLPVSEGISILKKIFFWFFLNFQNSSKANNNIAPTGLVLFFLRQVISRGLKQLMRDSHQDLDRR